MSLTIYELDILHTHPHCHATPVSPLEISNILGESSSVLTPEVQQKLLGDHNIAQLAHFDDGKDGRFLTTPFNQLGLNKFLEPEANVVYTVDHFSKTATESGPASEPENAQYEAARKAASDALKAYVQTHYKRGKCVTGAFIKPGTSILALCISGINTNFSAYWTGNLRSTYEVDLAQTGPQPLKGGLKANVHYYESGNVQFNAEKNVSVNVDASNIQGVVDAIKNFESDWQNGVDKMFVDMHEQTFKQMRRILPLTRTKMNWNPTAHALTEEFAQ